MPKPNQSLAFDFAKDFDREDEEKKRVAREQHKKVDAEIRRSAEQFTRGLRLIAKKAGYSTEPTGLRTQAPNQPSQPSR